MGKTYKDGLEEARKIVMDLVREYQDVRRGPYNGAMMRKMKPENEILAGLIHRINKLIEETTQ